MNNLAFIYTSLNRKIRETLIFTTAKKKWLLEEQHLNAKVVKNLKKMARSKSVVCCYTMIIIYPISCHYS